MKRTGKIIRMNTGYFEGISGMFLIYRKNNPCKNTGNKSDNSNKPALMRPVHPHTKKN